MRRPDHLSRASDALESLTAEAILAWAADEYAPRVTFGTGFGVEGCVLIHMIAAARLPIDIYTLDTGLLFPETYGLWRRLEQRYGLTIRAVRPAHSVAEQAAAHGPALWSRQPDRCCALRKVGPQREVLAGFDAWISAIRREQTAERAAAPIVGYDAGFGVVKISPLARWTSDEVWRFARAHDVPYNPLHDEGYPSIGCHPCTTPVAAGEDPRSGRWRGRDKQECGLHGRLADRLLFAKE